MPPVGTTVAIACTVCYMYQSEIKKIVKDVCKDIYDIIYSQIEVDTKMQPKITYAIKKELSNLNKNHHLCVARDGPVQPNYDIQNGKYKLCSNGQIIKFQLEDEKIIVYSTADINFLKNYIDTIYKRHCTTDNVIMFYTSKKDGWEYPIFRRPRDINVSSKMQKVLDDVQVFSKAETEQSYKDDGHPYRKGYLFVGDPGTGKSQTIEKIAMKYNRQIYIQNLNDEGETDASLIRKISSVPPNSIIVFEEIDRQMKTLARNQNNKISEGGILSAIDGPQRLSHGTIVILTTNNIDDLSIEFKKALLRPGRIDKKFNF